jgi:hypothetical protein
MWLMESKLEMGRFGFCIVETAIAGRQVADGMEMEALPNSQRTLMSVKAKWREWEGPTR